MKKILMLLCILLLSFAAFAENADEICGLWFFSVEKEVPRLIVEIYKENGLYHGRMVAMEGSYAVNLDTSRLDVHNPNPMLQDKPITSLAFLYDLKFNKNSWREGHMYSPENGKTYYAKASFDKANSNLEIKATIDSAGLFGPTFKLERVSKEEAVQYKNFPHNLQRNPWE